MSSTPDPASSSAATGSDAGPDQTETDAVEATSTADAVEPDTTEADPTEADTTEADTTEANPTEADTIEGDPTEAPAAPTAPTHSSSTSDESDEKSDDQSEDDSDDESDERSEEEKEQERQKSAEEFAAEHDPANHDIAAGEEFRQRGDWTAEDDGPQVFDADGNLVSDGDAEAGNTDDTAPTDGGGSSDDAGEQSGDGRRVSDLDEVTDGGYSVGSAATLHDGAMPVGHPVKAWEDTKTYVTEDHEHYAEAEPHVWFTDAEAAERAGFTPAD